MPAANKKKPKKKIQDLVVEEEKKKQIMPLWMLATSYNVLETDSSEYRASVNSVQPTL